MNRSILVSAWLVAAFAAMPAYAASGGSTSVPEPADFALFALGVVGLVIGRRSSRKRPASKVDTTKA